MRPVARARIERTAFGLLDASALCAISTISPHSTAHVNTAYFVWNHKFNIFWLSDPTARHSRNIHTRPSTAVAVFDSHQVWNEPDRGIQLFGSAHQVPTRESAHVESIYAACFQHYETPDLSAYRFYSFRPDRLKVFDETVFGSGVFVTATVRGGGSLIWERTEIASGNRHTLGRPGRRANT